MKRTRHASRRIAALVFLAAAVVPFALANPAHAAGGVEVKATINEIALENATANHPLKISPNAPADSTTILAICPRVVLASGRNVPSL